jgi:prepilin-type processing-associated H-X9-DG protein
MRTLRRPGFTLYQLLVLLALLALLAALFFPAIARVRQAAARTQSQNNLKQIALAVHNYYATNNVLPAGVDDNHFSAATHLLPYIEQDNLYKQLDLKQGIDAKANAPVRGAVIRTYLSPLDPLMVVKPGYGATNYLFNAGTQHALKDNNGLFFQNSKVRFNDVKDGTSNTVMAGETLKGNGKKQAETVKRQMVRYKADALKGLTDKAGVQDFKEGKHIAGDRCASWMDGRFLQGTYTATRKLNDLRPDFDCGGAGGLSALRTLGRVVNVAMCDGSVRSISLNVSQETWSAAHTRSGAEVLGSDF